MYDDDNVEIDIDVVVRFLTAVKYNEEDWQKLVWKVAQGSGLSLEKTNLAMEAIYNYFLELTQTN
ncbi:MAG: hypothetical protein P8183_12285 [Anaerolineae bacterium]|jgi:hypothetical protein